MQENIFSRNWWIEIEQQSPIEGRNDISNRRLTLKGCDATGIPAYDCNYENIRLYEGN